MILNEEQIQNSKRWLQEHLPRGPVVVTFTKKDGTERVMECTTDPTRIMFKEHEVFETTDKTPRKVNEDICTVYDLKSNGWRSFRWDSVKNVGFTVNDGHYIQTR